MSEYTDFKNQLLAAEGLSESSAAGALPKQIRGQARRLQARHRTYSLLSLCLWIVYAGAVGLALHLKVNTHFYGMEDTMFLQAGYEKGSQFYRYVNTGAAIVFLLAMISTLKLFFVNRKIRLPK